MLAYILRALLKMAITLSIIVTLVFLASILVSVSSGTVGRAALMEFRRLKSPRWASAMTRSSSVVPICVAR